MPRFTPEQEAAQQELQAAIIKHTELFKPKSRLDPEMVADWMVVVNVVSFNDEGDRMSAYNVAYSNGEMDEHRAVGLCEVAKAISLGTYEMTDDDD